MSLFSTTSFVSNMTLRANKKRKIIAQFWQRSVEAEMGLCGAKAPGKNKSWIYFLYPDELVIYFDRRMA